MKHLDHRFCIAPMMQCTDIHDRYLIRLITKKAILYTEMVTTGAIIHGNCMHQLDFRPEIEHPIAVQLGGSDPHDLSVCAKLCEQLGYDEINLNVGCPSERVQKGAFGACLMLEPNLVSECINAMQNSVDIPITVKCRIGVDKNDDLDFLFNFIEKIKNPKFHTLIVHARSAILKGLSPRQNRQIPPLKYNHVTEAKKAFPDLEIIINGGIIDIDESVEHLQNVDGVMLGRSAYDNPMILKHVDSRIYGVEDTMLDRKEILQDYLEYCIQQSANGFPYSRTLKHVFGINRGMANAKTYRKLILESMQTNELKSHVNDLVAMV